MVERGILFRPEMVIELLADRKLETRRIMKPQPEADKAFHGGWVLRTKNADTAIASINLGVYPDICPYGVPGDRLYVREAWRTLAMWDSLPPRGIPNLGRIPIKYEADGAINGPTEYPYGRYRHARFMPRDLARIRLELIVVRAERLQTITDAGAIAEGIAEPLPAHGKWCDPKKGRAGHWSYRRAYAVLFDKINGAGAWDRNDFVWVIRFKRLRK